jgi:hypothetical protein
MGKGDGGQIPASEELTPGQKVAINDYLFKWFAALGAVNLAAVLSGLFYVFAVLPKEAKEEVVNAAKADIRGVLEQLKTDARREIGGFQDELVKSAIKAFEDAAQAREDVAALCGEPQFDDEQKDTLLNPDVIIEVLSPSTEAYDRGGKFGHYRKLASLKEYVLVAQEEPHIELYVRQADNQWLLSEASGLQDAVHLPSVNCRLSLADVYEKIEFGL